MTRPVTGRAVFVIAGVCVAIMGMVERSAEGNKHVTRHKQHANVITGLIGHGRSFQVLSGGLW